MTKLTSLAKKYNSDKYGRHFYTDIYEKYMHNKKNKKILLLEIGVGGYKDGHYNHPTLGGESLRVWRDYFKKSKIIALDIFEKKLKLGSRVKLYKGSQSNYFDLKKIIKKNNKFDFIIDDGSHLYKDVIFSFNFLFKHLKDGGFYFIEDIQTSYLREFGGDGMFLENKKNIVNFFKKIIDKINYQEIENPYFKPDYFCKNITEIHFYHNLIVIKKKKNSEVSTILVNNRRLVSGHSFLKTRRLVKEMKYFLLFIKSRINYFFNSLTI